MKKVWNTSILWYTIKKNMVFVQQVQQLSFHKKKNNDRQQATATDNKRKWKKIQ